MDLGSPARPYSWHLAPERIRRHSVTRTSDHVLREVRILCVVTSVLRNSSSSTIRIHVPSRIVRHDLICRLFT
jgi:hypothetical protein